MTLRWVNNEIMLVLYIALKAYLNSQVKNPCLSLIDRQVGSPFSVIKCGHTCFRLNTYESNLSDQIPNVYTRDGC